MRIVADEGVDAAIVQRLRERGYEVVSVAEVSPSITDTEVLRLASDKQAVLVTTDKDFGEIVFRRQHRPASFGVLLLRLSELSRSEEVDAAVTTVATYERHLEQAFSVLTPKSLRIRPIRASDR